MARGDKNNGPIPVDSLKPWESFKRVPGVGVSAIIDIRI